MDGPWPSFLLVGGTKCGTTTLYELLRRHPDVFLPDEKEPHGFTAMAEARGAEAREAAEARYLDLFRGAGSFAARGEATTTYLHEPGVPELIRSVLPEARILVSLRDPVKRAQAHFLMHVAGGEEKRGFLQALEDEVAGGWKLDPGSPMEPQMRSWYLRRSLYAHGVERYLDLFGAQQVKVVLVDELKADPRALLRGIFAFLGVDPEPAATMDVDVQANPFQGVPYGGLVERLRSGSTAKRVGRALLPKGLRDWLGNEVLLRKGPKPAPEAEAVALIQRYAGPDVARLEELLDRDLPELRASFRDEL